MLDIKCIENYKTYLRGVRRASENTIVSYVNDVSNFMQFIPTNGKTNLSDVTQDDINSYIGFLKNNNKSQATISRNISSLKAFYSHLIDTGVLATNPVSNITMTKTEKKPPIILTGEEIKLILKKPDIHDIKGCRDKAMFEILYATGIRVSELINLDETDINTVTGLLTCRNVKERIIPIHETAIKATRRYLSYARPKMITTDEQALFVNTNGKRMTRQGFWKILKNYAEQLEIHTAITPQILRNSFAAHLLENGANIKTLQEILGHSGISSTHAYARVVKQNLKDEYSKTHPRA